MHAPMSRKQRRNYSATGDRVFDRLAEDLPHNSEVMVDIVDDPIAPTDKLKVLRSVRSDPLAVMFLRGQIDKANYEAGRLWQKYHEQSEVGQIAGIDPTKEFVDGGRFREPVSSQYGRAINELKDADEILGLIGCALVRDVLGKSMTISECARTRYLTTAREINFLGRRFRECLDSLAVLWGLSG